MRDLVTRYHQRNQAIGKLIREARVAKQVTITKCAQVVGTTRRRFSGIENGSIMIGLLEAEVLTEFLEIPFESLRSVTRHVATRVGKTVHVKSGETIQLIIITCPENETA
jgi:transcriptional regulator with XRE-family HTH domain